MDDTDLNIWNLLLPKIWLCKNFSLPASACLSYVFQSTYTVNGKGHIGRRICSLQLPLSLQRESMHGLDAARSIEIRLHSELCITALFLHNPEGSCTMASAAVVAEGSFSYCLPFCPAAALAWFVFLVHSWRQALAQHWRIKQQVPAARQEYKSWR